MLSKHAHRLYLFANSYNIILYSSVLEHYFQSLTATMFIETNSMLLIWNFRTCYFIDHVIEEKFSIKVNENIKLIINLIVWLLMWFINHLFSAVNKVVSETCIRADGSNNEFVVNKINTLQQNIKKWKGWWHQDKFYILMLVTYDSQSTPGTVPSL